MLNGTQPPVEDKEDKYILFLDDDPARAALAYERMSEDKRSRTIWCRTVEEAVDVILEYNLEEAHLDHDLGGETYCDTRREDCGMEVIRNIERMSGWELAKLKHCKFVVHSWNLKAGETMVRRLLKLELFAEHKPFGS